jgi:LmbE family N-acetylglucosaminyl deacetylase
MNTGKHGYKNILQTSEFKSQISDFRFQIKKKSVFICVHLWLISLCFFLFPPEHKAQVRPVYDYGAIGLGQLLKRLNNTKSVMHIGAHPDDEDSGLLAYLARGENARTAYLSLTRGDGGQNILGTELSESLGVIRTEELLQARRLDGAEQFFTRAYDYGFSKTLDEAKSKWDEKIILCDAVKAIRYFRPLVVISRFSGTPADGHGQHQFAGYIAPLAVKAAADSNQCTDSGAAWQVLKFYVGQGFRSTSEPTLKINTGAYDFLLGRSYFEIAMEGRSQHKTQEQGVLELRGERFSGLNLIESRVPKVENETSVFDGLPDSPEANESARRALQEYEPANPQKIVPILIEGLRSIRQSNEKNYLLEQFSEAVTRAAGIKIDALADKEIVVSDESFLVTTRVYFPNISNVKIKEIKLQTPGDWQLSKAEAPKETNQGFFRREVANETAYFNVKVPKNAELTQPFWLEKRRKGDLFDIQNGENPIEPFQKPPVKCHIIVEVNGTEINLIQPVEYRYADDIRGEIRRNLNVAPKISLNLDQNLLIVPQSAKAQTRRIVLSMTNNGSTPTSGEVKLNAPKEIKISPASASFNLKNKGGKTAVAFDITIPARFKIGDYELGAQALTANGETFMQTMNTLAYPHIQTHRFYTESKTKITVLDLKTAPAKIGYIMGSGDEVPEAIRQIGLAVELLSEMDLTSGDLSGFSTIVVGVRAAQVRQDFVANHERLIDYVKGGGVLIVQFQRPDYETLLPFPAKLGARVVDETAKVTILDVAHPIFNRPNRITGEDFAGWVQERNLYAFTSFDANYKPLLEAHDGGEPENRGGLVVANIGRGKYVYCSYAFFRQLPAGVPGAYRVFANLLSLK